MIKDGEVIIFPTDTVYGIGAKVSDKLGQQKIYEIKERPENKRLSVLCSSLDDILKIAEVNSDALKLIKTYMPGGLTLILKTKKEFINDFLYDTVGVRIPNHKLALEILKENGPMATTSVNKSGMPPLNDYHEILEHFGKDVSCVYENNEALTGTSSTVINLTTNPYSLIREGDLKFQDLMDFLSK